MQKLPLKKEQTISVEALQNAIWENCGAFHLEPIANNGLMSGSFLKTRIGYYDAALISLNAKYIERNHELIRKDPGEYLFLIIQEEGICWIEQNGYMAQLQAGDMYFVDSVRPSIFIYEGVNSIQRSLHLPREEMILRLGDACLNGAHISRADGLWHAICVVLEKIQTEILPPPQLNEAFLSLLGAHFHRSNKNNPVKKRETLLSRALDLIDRSYLDPSFRVSDLARQLNVPDRMLQRHFQLIGETPSRRLLNRRLQFAHTRLINSNRTKIEDGIAAIAYDSGFNDLSHFYREFKKKYDVTPGALMQH